MNLDQLRADSCGVSVKTYRRLLRFGWPVVCFNLLYAPIRAFGPPVNDLWNVEFFLGVGVVKRAFTQHGMKAEGFDIINAVDPDWQSLVTPLLHRMLLAKVSFKLLVT